MIQNPPSKLPYTAHPIDLIGIDVVIWGAGKIFLSDFWALPVTR